MVLSTLERIDDQDELTLKQARVRYANLKRISNLNMRYNGLINLNEIIFSSINGLSVQFKLNDISAIDLLDKLRLMSQLQFDVLRTISEIDVDILEG